jgi:hypothetical protein
MKAFPQWTTELREQRSGLDHLGLAAVSNQILTNLSPDLFVQTRRPGYFSFYSFVLDEFWKRDDLPRRRSTWKDFFRSKDLIYSVACNTCAHPAYGGTFGSIVGSQKTASLASSDTDEYATDFNYIKNDFAGYGLYYRSVMASLGLVYPGPQPSLPVDVPTDEGRQLAAAFRSRISGTEYWRSYFDSPRVPAQAVREYGEVGCLCRLREGADLDLVRSAVLQDPREMISAQRRSSLRMLLDLGDATSGYPLSEDAFRQLIYYGTSLDGAQWRPRSWEVTPDGQLSVLDSWRRWRLFQAREFYAFALNGLWRWLVKWGLENGGDFRPIPVSAAVAALQSAIDERGLSALVGVDIGALETAAAVGRVLRTLRTLSGDPEIYPDHDDDWPDREFDLAAPLSEWKLYTAASEHRSNLDVLASSSLALLLLTATRLDHAGHRFRPDWHLAQSGGSERLSLDRFITTLRSMIVTQATIGGLVERLLHSYVLQQHIRIANSKLPFDTFRFVLEDGRLRFFDRSRPIGLNSARFDTLANTLSDLDFCSPLMLAEHAVTDAGRDLLETGNWQGAP